MLSRTFKSTTGRGGRRSDAFQARSRTAQFSRRPTQRPIRRQQSTSRSGSSSTKDLPTSTISKRPQSTLTESKLGIKVDMEELARLLPESTEGSIVNTMTPRISVPLEAKDFKPMDGNTAAATVAYANSEVSFIYPISPATSMGETMDALASSGKLNAIGDQPVHVEVMQSEGGAAGAVHGALASGALASSFTASQGLLLMIPNMYLIAGELMPCVLHVSARTVAKQALCIFNDHSDVMAVRQTGWAQLASNNAQEVMDLGLVSHLATVKSRVPFLHFFDGNRTSHEISNIHSIPYEDMKKLIRHDLIEENFRRVSLNPSAPIARGTGQRPDIFFASNLASERFYRQTPAIVEECMKEVEQITGRRYHLFDYYGHPEAEKVIVVMCSAGETTQQAVKHMIENTDEKVGVVKVRLYRPWSSEHLLAALPRSTKKIAVIDRTREEGSLGGPLFLDVSVALREAGRDDILVTGGHVGLGQKEFTPTMVEAIYDNLDAPEGMRKMRFTIGVEDDVTFTSLAYKPELDASMPASTRQCLFWGLGSDGTVGANKEAIKMIADNTDLNAQGFFAYDSKKSGGVTMSHLRFGPEEIHARYEIAQAGYIACHNPTFIGRLDILETIAPGGTFVLNSPWTLEEMETKLPAQMKRQIAQNDVEFYNIDATAIAQDVGLKMRINMVMQTCFFTLSKVLPADDSIALLKQNIEDVFGKKKGPRVVKMNHEAVDRTRAALQKIEYPKEAWKNAVDAEESEIPEWDALLRAGVPEFVQDVMEPCMSLKGGAIPVSKFEPGGVFPVGTTRYERRGGAPAIPVWLPDKCTQCNYCAIVCPHAVIRPFLLSKDEAKAAPEGFLQRKAKGGAELSGLNYTIQVAPMDCTGCEVCVQSCPDDALIMTNFNEVAEANLPMFEYAMSLPNKNPTDKFSVKGSQFEQPLLEFHAACAGCGETPYVKLLTQLYGQDTVIANASGCSSVWGGTCTTHPYTTNKETGRGPAWGRSLFEDNAEYGFGMLMASKQRRKRLAASVQNYLNNEAPDNDPLTGLMREWMKFIDDRVKGNDVCDKLLPMLEERCGADSSPLLKSIQQQHLMFRPQSQWLIGGDGWAYDIGSSGLDHVLHKGENLNILVLDTEIYSNTGGQTSKASTMGQVTKFDSLGKTRNKSDLGQKAMALGDVYVASVAMGADYNQTLKAFKEAEEYPGTSLIIAYSPCIDWGIDMKNMMDIQRIAVECGYWNLYRFDPRNEDQGHQPLIMDTKRLKTNVNTYLETENRFARLQRDRKERAENLHGQLSEWIQHRHDKLMRMSMDDLELLDDLKQRLGEETGEKMMILYGSETGNAAEFAAVIGHEVNRRGVRTKVMACDDFDFDSLSRESNVIFVMATCGQGELPGNCKDFYSRMNEAVQAGGNSNLLENTNVSVFGMGDSHYVYFNEAARLYDEGLRALGANVLVDYGQGDDQDDEKYETAFEEWGPQLWSSLNLPEPERKLFPSTYEYEIMSGAGVSDLDESSHGVFVPSGASLVPITTNRLLTPEEYDRDTRHYEFGISSSQIISGASAMSYEVGDSLGVYAHNQDAAVEDFIRFYSDGQWTMGDTVALTDLNASERKDPLPEKITMKQLFGQVLDVFGRPKRRFYEMLSMVAQDEQEAEQLRRLSNPSEGAEEYRALVAETYTHADLLKAFPSARPTIDYMIDYIPRIKPRLYSIASSPNENPDSIHLCVVVDDWTTPNGTYRRGLCSDYLTHQDPNVQQHVVAKVNAGVVTMPDTQEHPMIMVGLGTGIAPIRGMIRDRVWAKNDDPSQKIGPMALYFGARYRASEYLYEDEFMQFHDGGNGPLNHINTAFSRDQAHKIYVHNRMEEDQEMIHDWLFNNGGYFYACGSSAVNDLKGYIAKNAAGMGKMSEDEANEALTQMQIEGRYNIEAW